MIYYYGGSFDPITKAHKAIIRKIKKEMRDSDKLIIGIVQNDEKNYNVSVNDRLNMVKKSLDAHEIVIQDKRTYAYLDAHYRGEKITICMGDDEWYSLCSGKWVNWDLLLKHYEFMVFYREDNDEIYREDNDEIVLPAGINPTVTFLSAEDTDGISSTAVREILFKNPECHYSDVRDYITHVVFRYIKEHELYFQNGPDYEKKEKQFLAEYAIKKAKNGWGEPSVTADVVAYNGDEILLIRRGNFPYKNYWCTVGGFFDLTDEDLSHTASREFMEETTLKYSPADFHQIKTYSHQFDPRMRIIDTAFEVRIAKKDMKNAVGSDDAAEARWFNINDLPNLGFHHNQIIEDWKKKHNKEDYL